MHTKSGSFEQFDVKKEHGVIAGRLLWFTFVAWVFFVFGVPNFVALSNATQNMIMSSSTVVATNSTQQLTSTEATLQVPMYLIVALLVSLVDKGFCLDIVLTSISGAVATSVALGGFFLDWLPQGYQQDVGILTIMIGGSLTGFVAVIARVALRNRGVRYYNAMRMLVERVKLTKAVGKKESIRFTYTLQEHQLRPLDRKMEHFFVEEWGLDRDTFRRFVLINGRAWGSEVSDDDFPVTVEYKDRKAETQQLMKDADTFAKKENLDAYSETYLAAVTGGISGASCGGVVGFFSVASGSSWIWGGIAVLIAWSTSAVLSWNHLCGHQAVREARRHSVNSAVRAARASFTMDQARQHMASGTQMLLTHQAHLDKVVPFYHHFIFGLLSVVPVLLVAVIGSLTIGSGVSKFVGATFFATLGFFVGTCSGARLQDLRKGVMDHKLHAIYWEALCQCCAQAAVALLCAYPVKPTIIVSVVCSLTFCAWGFIFVPVFAFVWYDDQVLAVFRAIYILIDGMGLYQLAENSVATEDDANEDDPQKWADWEEQLKQEVREDQQEGTENPKYLWICQRVDITEDTFVNEDVEKEDVTVLKESLRDVNEKIDKLLEQTKGSDSEELTMLDRLEQRVRTDDPEDDGRLPGPFSRPNSLRGIPTSTRRWGPSPPTNTTRLVGAGIRD